MPSRGGRAAEELLRAARVDDIMLMTLCADDKGGKSEHALSPFRPVPPPLQQQRRPRAEGSRAPPAGRATASSPQSHANVRCTPMPHTSRSNHRVSPAAAHSPPDGAASLTARSGGAQLCRRRAPQAAHCGCVQPRRVGALRQRSADAFATRCTAATAAPLLAYERGFSFLPLNSASSDTPDTLTTCRRAAAGAASATAACSTA